jgi:hypothetical protein
VELSVLEMEVTKTVRKHTDKERSKFYGLRKETKRVK